MLSHTHLLLLPTVQSSEKDIWSFGRGRNLVLKAQELPVHRLLLERRYPSRTRTGISSAAIAQPVDTQHINKWVECQAFPACLSFLSNLPPFVPTQLVTFFLLSYPHDTHAHCKYVFRRHQPWGHCLDMVPSATADSISAPLEIYSRTFCSKLH